VAADAGQRAAALGHRVEVLCGQPGQKVGMRRWEDAVAERLLGLEEGQARLDAIGGEEAADARGDDAGDHGRRQLAGGRQQPFAVVYVAAVRAHSPFSSNLPMTRGRTSSRQL
jgi:hypothetical protein